MTHSPGRPIKPEGQKRKQLHISLYAEDIERLDQLTDNRSDFVRQCISEAWAKRTDPGMTVSITLPQSTVSELLQFVEDRLSPEEMGVVQKVVKSLVTTKAA